MVHGFEKPGESIVKKEAHAHCWHVLSSFTNGLGVAGSDKEQCCHCGKSHLREWTVKPDPAHGTYVQQNIVVYKDRQ